MDLTQMSAEDLAGHRDGLENAYQDLRGRNVQIDMTRGKPAPEQLDLSDGLLTAVGPGECKGEDGFDYRNYGILDGIPEAKRFFAEYMQVSTHEIIVGGNASLPMMYEAILGGMIFGMPGGDAPWRDQGTVKFLCPVPGYDRHFAICERLGIEMINIEMTETGPDMDAVEAAVADDPAVKGMWCVPKYSNPTGIVYSDETVDRLAAMSVAAPDFRVIWDNAYAVHHMGGGPAPVKNLLAACKDAGNPDRVLMFGSTSKISLAGAGVGVLAASETNIKNALKAMSFSTIGPDKINQLRHVRFFGDVAGLNAHMDKLAALIGPKFEAVEGGPGAAPGRPWDRHLDPAGRRLFRQCRCARRLRRRSHPADRRRGCQTDRRRLRLSLRQGPARPQYPPGADHAVGRRNRRGHERVLRLR